MKECLNKIRPPEYGFKSTQIGSVLVCILLGVVLGTFSKFLDTTATNTLPYVFGHLDLGNFFGRFAIWIFIATCISIYSKSPYRAAAYVFVFFAGMVSSYYLYSTYIAGFFPKSYAMIWGVFTLSSPILAFICWYAKGKGKIPFIISVGITAVMFNLAFAYGWVYLDVRYILELILFIAIVIVLHRDIKQTTAMLVLGVIVGIAMDAISPIHFW